MNTTASPSWRTALLLALCLAPAVSAAVFYTSGTLDLPVPDDTDTGLVRTLEVADSFTVASLTVSLNLSVPAGEIGWAGDLYAYLQHDTGFSVLLNRPGRTAGSPFGYADGQSLTISLRDDATNGDLHTYRTALGGGALTGPLTGAWQPDGRTTDPASAVTGDPRTALLSQFDGVNSAGTWTLFLADLSGGGRYQLNDWSLNLEGSPVPEPAVTVVTTSFLLTAWSLLRRRRGRLAT
ncbi:MAG TPA: PEP-CTERM sorting domain-containing protein [Candidatus Limnocylindria bacterium]|jgi:subtilisin-like proprotein convertase family protein|nr:PEP-CTERM sorting domain-containing protein [Candidatus Limnocylindria bacterium]